MPPSQQKQQPLLFEVNTRHWLAEMSRRHNREIDLAGVPEDELDVIERNGFTHLWLMGVWPTGPRSRAEAVRHPDLRKAYDDALPGWNDDDVLGSPYAVGALHVSPLYGGDTGLSHLRDRLDERGIKLILDFVPNHLGLDHAWVQARPQLFVNAAHEFPDSFACRTAQGTRYLAHGKDPWFPGWTDTAQVDYRRAETRRAMKELVKSIADRCDGVRCDMAMLVLNEVFEKTWAHVPLDVDRAQGEFWNDTIAHVKQAYPEFTFLAEAYWDLEGRLCDLGFDYAYDKKLYDMLVHDKPWEVQPHLLGMGEHNARRAHFIENHDEKRVNADCALDLHKAAAVLIMGLPGMRFLHDGQFEGLKRFARIQLARRCVEPVDEAVRALYAKLLPAFAESAVGKGVGTILRPIKAWEENWTAGCFTLVQWQVPGQDDRFDLVVVNLGHERGACRAPLSATGLAGGTWHLADRLGTEKWVRDGDDLARAGLWLDLPPRGAQLFSFRRL